MKMKTKIFVKDENEVYQVSMFEYPEAESLGLIKNGLLRIRYIYLLLMTL